jgi:hypothetical protein
MEEELRVLGFYGEGGEEEGSSEEQLYISSGEKKGEDTAERFKARWQVGPRMDYTQPKQ